MLAGPVTGGVPVGTPLFIYTKNYEVIPMSKPFMTYDQQIQKLKDKHLIIPNCKFRLNGTPIPLAAA